MKRYAHNFYVALYCSVTSMFQHNPRKFETYAMSYKLDPNPYIDVDVFYSEVVKELCS